MLYVVADDFTGAAETAGAAWRHGLSGEIVTECHDGQGAELTVLDTHSRGLTNTVAEVKLAKVGQELNEFLDGQVYKKVDSVLRGPVLAELRALADGLDTSGVFLVPGNPEQGRRLQDGRFLIDGVPIGQTDFRNDPLHAVASSRVGEMLGSVEDVLVVSKAGTCPWEASERQSVIVGEASSIKDLRFWARKVPPSFLLAGATEFFSTLLSERWGFPHAVRSGSPGILPDSSRTLFLSGSSSGSSRDFSLLCEAQGVPVCPIPRSFQVASNFAATVNKWSELIQLAFDHSQIVRASFDLPVFPERSVSRLLTRYLTELLSHLLDGVGIEILCVEGGETASRAVRDHSWAPLSVCAEIRAGVVILTPATKDPPFLITKPGSYRWPKSLLERLGIRDLS